MSWKKHLAKRIHLEFECRYLICSSIMYVLFWSTAYGDFVLSKSRCRHFFPPQRVEIFYSVFPVRDDFTHHMNFSVLENDIKDTVLSCFFFFFLVDL